MRRNFISFKSHSYVFVQIFYSCILPYCVMGLPRWFSGKEMRVQSLSPEEPLQKEMATHSNIPAWEIPWTEDPGGLQSMGCKRVGRDLATKTIPVLESFKYRFERAFSVKKVVIKLSHVFKKFNTIFWTLFMFAMQNFKNNMQ